MGFLMNPGLSHIYDYTHYTFIFIGGGWGVYQRETAHFRNRIPHITLRLNRDATLYTYHRQCQIYIYYHNVDNGAQGYPVPLKYYDLPMCISLYFVYMWKY